MPSPTRRGRRTGRRATSGWSSSGTACSVSPSPRSSAAASRTRRRGGSRSCGPTSSRAARAPSWPACSTSAPTSSASASGAQLESAGLDTNRNVLAALLEAVVGRLLRRARLRAHRRGGRRRLPRAHLLRLRDVRRSQDGAAGTGGTSGALRKLRADGRPKALRTAAVSRPSPSSTASCSAPAAAPPRRCPSRQRRARRSPGSTRRPEPVHLSALRIRGFKSFPEQVELRFFPGVAVIVGPNGSGKSNISDSLQWAMAASAPSAIRAQAGTDVLFAGTDGRPAAGVCEVELVLDNSDGAHRPAAGGDLGDAPPAPRRHLRVPARPARGAPARGAGGARRRRHRPRPALRDLAGQRRRGAAGAPRGAPRADRGGRGPRQVPAPPPPRACAARTGARRPRARERHRARDPAAPAPAAAAGDRRRARRGDRPRGCGAAPAPARLRVGRRHAAGAPRSPASASRPRSARVGALRRRPLRRAHRREQAEGELAGLAAEQERARRAPGGSHRASSASPIGARALRRAARRGRPRGRARGAQRVRARAGVGRRPRRRRARSRARPRGWSPRPSTPTRATTTRSPRPRRAPRTPSRARSRPAAPPATPRPPCSARAPRLARTAGPGRDARRPSSPR